MIQRLWQVKISFYTLQSFYKSHNLSYKSCKAVYRTYLERQPRLKGAIYKRWGRSSS